MKQKNKEEGADLAGGASTQKDVKQLISPCSGRDCVKSLRSSYMGLYPQSTLLVGAALTSSGQTLDSPESRLKGLLGSVSRAIKEEGAHRAGGGRTQEDVKELCVPIRLPGLPQHTAPKQRASLLLLLLLLQHCHA